MDSNTRFLIDECLSPKLVDIANGEFHFFATTVRWWGKPPYGHKSWKDPDIVEKLAAEPFVLVTNNRRDFVGKYYKSGGLDVHDGLVIILEKTDLSAEIELFRTVMRHIITMKNTVNKLIEIDKSGAIQVAEWPNPELADPWQDPFKAR